MNVVLLIINVYHIKPKNSMQYSHALYTFTVVRCSSVVQRPIKSRYVIFCREKSDSTRSDAVASETESNTTS